MNRRLAGNQKNDKPSMVRESVKGKLNKRAAGKQNETIAADYLGNAGMKILFRNYRCRLGEIDLIALDGQTIVFVEVKYRSSDRYGSPLEAVDARKRRRIVDAACVFMRRFSRFPRQKCRFDVVGITPWGVRHIRNAFPADRDLLI